MRVTASGPSMSSSPSSCVLARIPVHAGEPGDAPGLEDEGLAAACKRPLRPVFDAHGPSGPSLEVFADEPEKDPVHPVAVTPVGLAANTLPLEAGPLEVAEGGLVEAVDLELHPVVVEVEDQMPDEELRRRGRESPPAVGGGEHDRVQEGDPAAAVGNVEGQHPGELALDLEHEPAVQLGLLLRAANLLLQLVALSRRDGRHERLHLLVAGKSRHEPHVGRRRAAKAEGPPLERGAHAGGHAGSISGSAWRRRRRRRRPSAPDPSATPARISTSPSAAFSVTCSSRISAP